MKKVVRAWVDDGSPSSVKLEALLACGFQGSGKDFSHQIALMKALGLKPGMRVLDYGATGAMRPGSFGVLALMSMVSKFRSRVLPLQRSWECACDEDPALETRQMKAMKRSFHPMCWSMCRIHSRCCRINCGMTKRGGLVIAHTPNGSRARLSADAWVSSALGAGASSIADGFVCASCGR